MTVDCENCTLRRLLWSLKAPWNHVSQLTTVRATHLNCWVNCRFTTRLDRFAAVVGHRFRHNALVASTNQPQIQARTNERATGGWVIHPYSSKCMVTHYLMWAWGKYSEVKNKIKNKRADNENAVCFKDTCRLYNAFQSCHVTWIDWSKLPYSTGLCYSVRDICRNVDVAFRMAVDTSLVSEEKLMLAVFFKMFRFSKMYTTKNKWTVRIMSSILSASCVDFFSTYTSPTTDLCFRYR